MPVCMETAIRNMIVKVRRSKYIRVLRRDDIIVAWIYAELLQPDHADYTCFQQMYYASNAVGYTVALDVSWTLADNSSILVNPTMLTEVLNELAIRGLQLHNKCRQLKLEVDSATTPEEVKSVRWD